MVDEEQRGVLVFFIQFNSSTATKSLNLIKISFAE